MHTDEVISYGHSHRLKYWKLIFFFIIITVTYKCTHAALSVITSFYFSESKCFSCFSYNLFRSLSQQFFFQDQRHICVASFPSWGVPKFKMKIAVWIHTHSTYSRSKEKKRNIPINANTKYRKEMKLIPIDVDYCFTLIWCFKIFLRGPSTSGICT